MRPKPTQAALARAIGVTPNQIGAWISHGKCPADRVLDVEKASGVSRHRLRPDVFGKEPSPPPEEGEAA